MDKKEIRSIVLKETAEKIRLEEKFKRDLKRDFSNISNFLYLSLLTNPNGFNLEKYLDEFRSTLKSNYRRITKQFRNKNRVNLAGELNLSRDKDELISLSFFKYVEETINTKSDKQATIILNTTKKEIVEHYEESLKQVGSSFLIGSAIKEVAKKTTDKFEKTIDYKTSLISSFETQQTSENSKLIEASILKRDLDIGLNKSWISFLDSRTRPAHASADEQQVPIDDFYLVGGEKLMYPSDISLGASIENTINCRCNSVVNI